MRATKKSGGSQFFARSNVTYHFYMVIVKADSGWTDMGTIAAYEILPTALVVHIVYMEAQPTLDDGSPRYRGIGRLLIA